MFGRSHGATTISSISAIDTGTGSESEYSHIDYAGDSEFNYAGFDCDDSFFCYMAAQRVSDGLSYLYKSDIAYTGGAIITALLSQATWGIKFNPLNTNEINAMHVDVLNGHVFMGGTGKYLRTYTHAGQVCIVVSPSDGTIEHYFYQF